MTRTVESKTAEMEASLVGFADKVVSLKGQLEIKTKVRDKQGEGVWRAWARVGSAMARRLGWVEASWKLQADVEVAGRPCKHRRREQRPLMQPFSARPCPPCPVPFSP